MKTDLNFLELKFIVKELQDCVGSRVSKVYDPDGILLHLHKSGVGKFLLRISNHVVWLASSKPESPATPSQLCKVLRKYIEGKKLISIEQLGSERIFQLRLETQKETFFLIAELFANGNIILTDGDKKIVTAREMRAWKDREIKRGLIYSPPPSKKNLFELNEQDIVNDEKKLASLGFGKLLAKEIIARGGDFKAYKSVIKSKFSPRTYSDGMVSPFKLSQYAEQGKISQSFSELLDVKPEEKEPVDTFFEKKKAKLQEIISLQLKSAEELEKKSAETQVIGETIYEHYQELNDLLSELKKISKKHSLQDMKKKLKGHTKIKDINSKTHDIIVEI